MSDTPSNVFRNTFLNKVHQCISDARGVEDLDHQGLKGIAREIFVARMMMPVMPPEVRNGSGQLVSHDGKNSSQIDVVLYAPHILPAALFDTSTGLFPVEATLYTIEVKSRLTAANLKEAIANARSIRVLPTIHTEHWYVKEGSGNLFNITTGSAYPVNMLFAFDTDLAIDGMDEITRYRNYDENANGEPAIQAICVVGRGYWYFEKNGSWKHMPATPQLDEVMTFLAGTTNTIPQLLVVKGRPRFGLYLQPDEKPFKDT